MRVRGHAPTVQRTAAQKVALDLPTILAVVDLRKAVRDLRATMRACADRTGGRAFDRLAEARRKRDVAVETLESLLEETP